MYLFAQIVEALAYLAVIAIAGVLVMPALRARRETVRHAERERRVGSVPTYERADEVVSNVREAQKASLNFMGLPSVHAGRSLLNVPTFKPEQEGWQTTRTVVTTSRITALLKQGAIPGDLVEFDGGYVLFGTNGKTFLLQSHLLTAKEEDQLEQERKEAVERGDPRIENFQGLVWKVGTACGSHTPRNASDGKQSTIQVLSAHPDLGKDGMVSCLPSNLLDRQPHDYYDMRARTIEGETRVMLFFYAGGKWNCFIGRELGQAECKGLQAL